jgi:hypothetical protein
MPFVSEPLSEPAALTGSMPFNILVLRRSAGPGRRATDTQMGRRIGLQTTLRNFIAAFKTKAKLSIVDLLQGTLNAADLHPALAIGCQRHLLDLDRVHSGQSAHALLVQLDGSAILGARIPKFQKLIEHLFQTGAKPIVSRFAGIGHFRPHCSLRNGCVSRRSSRCSRGSRNCGMPMVMPV